MPRLLYKVIMDQIAQILHPHWGGTEGHTYVPDQLPGMVKAIRDGLESALADRDQAITDREWAETRRRNAEERAQARHDDWIDERQRGDNLTDQLAEARDQIDELEGRLANALAAYQLANLRAKVWGESHTALSAKISRLQMEDS